MRHGALRDLDEHGEHGLLETVAELRGGEPDLAGGLVDGGLAARLPRVLLPHLRRQCISRQQDPAEAAVHALHRVGQVEEDLARGVLRQLLDVVARGGVVADVQRAREAVEAVAHGDVEGLAEDAVALLGVRDDLGVAARDVQHDGVVGARDLAAHLDVSDAVVHADQGLAPEQGEGARGDGDALQRRAHARPLGVADAGQLGGRDARRAQRRPRDLHEERAVVLRRVLGQEPRPRRRDEGVPDVGEDGGLTRRRVVRYDADTELVGAAFAA